jgi:hypothetical protein
MSALLEEGGKRQQGREGVSGIFSKDGEQKSLNNLVESVKRKSHGTNEGKNFGKRRKLALK